MEIIDKPLNEIIKEQKIGESLRKNRRGNRTGKGAGDRSRAPQQQQQQQRQKTRGNRQSNQQHQQQGRGGRGGGGSPRGRLRLRLRARRSGRDSAAGSRRDGPSNGGRLAQRRLAVDFGDSRRERSAKGGPRRRVMDIDRNERTRSSRRREALSSARFSRN